MRPSASAFSQVLARCFSDPGGKQEEKEKDTKVTFDSTDIGVFVYVCRNIGMNMNIKENIIKNMNIDLSIFVFYCANLYFIALHIILHLTPLHFISLYCNNRRCGR